MTTHNAQGVKVGTPGMFETFNLNVLNECGYVPGVSTLSGAARAVGALAVIVAESLHAAGLAMASVAGPTPKIRGASRTKLPAVTKNVVSAAKHLCRGGVEITVVGGPVLYYRDQVLAKDVEIVRLKNEVAATIVSKGDLEKQIKSAETAIAMIQKEKEGGSQELSLAKLGLEERTKELDLLKKELASLNVAKSQLEDQLRLARTGKK